MQEVKKVFQSLSGVRREAAHVESHTEQACLLLGSGM